MLKTQKSLYGDTLAFIISPPEFNVNIDTLEDWEKAENMLQTRNE